MNENKNLILAVVLSVVIILGYSLFMEKLAPPPAQTSQQAGQQAADSEAVSLPSTGEGGVTPEAPGGAAVALERKFEDVLAEDVRIPVQTPSIEGSLRVKGARIDDLVLNGYRETLEDDSPLVRLLRPSGGPKGYFAEFGWIASEKDVALPGGETVWTVASGSRLTQDSSIVLTWDNGQGLRFTRTIAIDKDYMFTVTQKVENRGDKAVSLFPYGLVSRAETPEVLGFYILHEGLIGVFDEVLQEVDYDDLRESRRWEMETTGGWMGITDKYWLVSLVPDQKTPVVGRMRYIEKDGSHRYQVEYVNTEGTVLAPGATVEKTNQVFAGAKRVDLLTDYMNDQGIARFNFAVDFGWFHFFTRPIFWFLHWLHGIVGNYGIAILLVTVTIKLLFFPLANKSYKSMSQLKKLQPEMVALRERFPDDKQKMNQEMMAMYKKHKVNPASGCLPILLQIPVFFALYKVLFVTIEMRHAPFFGWIQDLSQQDPTNFFTLFGVLDWPVPDAMHIGIWPVIMGVTMFLQQKLNPAPADPVQAKIFMFLPLIFTFILARFPAGLVIYWSWNNLLSILQQYVIMRRMGVAVGGGAAPAPAAVGGGASGGKKSKQGDD